MREAMLSRRRRHDAHPAARAAVAARARSRSSSTATAPACSRSPTPSRTSTRCRATLRERGLRLLYDEPRRGTSDSRVNFIHPKDAGGVLVELVQPRSELSYCRVTSSPTTDRDRPVEGLRRGRHPHRDPDRRARRARRAARPRRPTRARWCGPTRSACSTGIPSTRQGPAQEPAPAGGADARARPGRGDRRGDGERDQLQHRLDVDLRAGVDVRVPQALRRLVLAGGQARPALPRGRLRPVRRRAARRAGRDAGGRPATRSSRTACRSSSRTRRATTTR